MRQERRKLSSGNPLAKAMNYSLERWAALTAMPRRARSAALLLMQARPASRKRSADAIWTFTGSDSGGRGAATIYTLIETAKLNDVDRAPGWPKSPPASPTTRPAALPSCCLGIGRLRGRKRR